MFTDTINERLSIIPCMYAMKFDRVTVEASTIVYAGLMKLKV